MRFFRCISARIAQKRLSLSTFAVDTSDDDERVGAEDGDKDLGFRIARWDVSLGTCERLRGSVQAMQETHREGLLQEVEVSLSASRVFDVRGA